VKTLIPLGFHLLNLQQLILHKKEPDFEFVGLVDSKDWKAKETLEEAIDRKNRFISKHQKEEINHNPYWNEKCRIAQQECDILFRKLQNLEKKIEFRI